MNFGQKCVLADQDVATCAADVLFSTCFTLGVMLPGSHPRHKNLLPMPRTTVFLLPHSLAEQILKEFES